MRGNQSRVVLATAVLAQCVVGMLSANRVLAQQLPVASRPVSTANTPPVSDQPTGDPAIGERIRQRFESGKIEIERWVVESANGDLVNHGPYARYNEQGQIMVSGVYQNGTRDGVWSKQLTAQEAEQLSGGTLNGFKPPFVSKASFASGKLNGQWVCTDSQGKIVFAWSFQDGLRHGTSTSFDAKGQVVRLLNYVKNQSHGAAKVAMGPNQPLKDTEFERGRMLHRVDKHYPSQSGSRQNVLRSQDWFLIPTPFNLEHHDWETNQVVYQPANETDRIRHGRAVTFYSNQQRESEGQYDHGKRVGTFAWWYPNGQQKTVGEYNDDNEEGVWNWWHENGMREATGVFAGGKKIDQWSVWDSQGKLVSRGWPASARSTGRMAKQNTSDDSSLDR